MTLRKKWVNTKLLTKTCNECEKTFPRTEEYFYVKKSKDVNVKRYYAKCITCENKRCAKYKSKTKEKNRLQNIKYKESEHGYFKELYNGITKSKHGSTFKSYEEFLECWEKQKKKYGLNCPYFPWIQMTRIKGKKKHTNTNISKDRILSSMPYGPNNIMFCSWKANNMKGEISPYLAARYLEFVNESEYCRKVTEFELFKLNNDYNDRFTGDVNIIASIIEEAKQEIELQHKFISKLRELVDADKAEH